jgi:hypothetical protein
MNIYIFILCFKNVLNGRYKAQNEESYMEKRESVVGIYKTQLHFKHLK